MYSRIMDAFIGGGKFHKISRMHERLKRYVQLLVHAFRRSVGMVTMGGDDGDDGNGATSWCRCRRSLVLR